MGGDRELADLRDQMEQTKALYEGAKLEYGRAIARMQDLGMAHPDGSIRQATHVLAYALESYCVALQAYNRFLLDHSQPTLESLKKRPTHN